jgi:small-conductance mechanosensitive channel
MKPRAGAAALLLVVAIAIGLVVARRATAAQPAVVPDAAAIAETKDALDRETPRRTLEGFLREAKQGNFRVAADYLDLRGIAAASRDSEGPDLAQKLSYVLERQATLNLAKVPDVPEGDPTAKPPDTFVADTLYAGEEPVPIAVKREHFPDGVERWLIAEKTVELIPVVDAAYGPRPIGVRLPATLTRPTFLGNELWQWIGVFAAIFISYTIARVCAAVLIRGASYFTFRTPTRTDDVLLESSRRPLRTIITALIYRLLLGPLQLTTAILEICEHVTYTALVLGVTWLLLRALGVSTLLLDEHAARESYDAFRGRQVRTQALLLRRVASVMLSFVAGAVVLMQFAFVRNVGLSLLASAGVLSVVAGLAAQRSLAGVIAGIQFSIAQPVRMSDHVLLEGELGEVEEIYLTYAVIRLWDHRRMIVPITYFLEKPFQNWTRMAGNLLGSVEIKVDLGVPVDGVREELRRICEADSLWDKRTCEVKVTDSDASSMTLRAIVSAEDASRLWDLRCRVRERLLAYVHAVVLARTAEAAKVSG